MRLQHILFITAVFAFTFVNANNNFTIKTVVIDAGHGGKDPGASGSSKTNEKDIALVVALKLGDYIQKTFPEVNVIYTRKTDVFLELHERAEIANKAKADLFIAVHCNSSPKAEAYGTSSYVLGLHRTEANLDVAKRENSVILLEENRDKNYEFDPNSPEGHIIMSMKQNAFLDQSIDFASKIENQLENYSKRKSLGVKQAGFYVLYKTTMPSLLAEIGFISNPEEEKFLNSVKGQDLIATGLFNAFKDYKGEMESGSSLSVATSVETKTETKTSASVAEIKTETVKTEPVKKEEVKTEAVKTEPAKAEVKTQTSSTSTTAVSKTNSSKATTERTEQNSVVIKSGKNIRKPIENSSGGGKGRPVNVQVKGEAGVQPIYVTASTLDPFDTMSMRTLNTKNKANTKAEPNTADAKANSSKATETKVAENKTASELEVKTESNKSPLVATHKTEGGTVFKIQLFALKGELKEYDKVAKLFEVLTAEELPNGFTRYYGGHVKSFTEAKNLLAVALDNGYKAAFIIGFKEGNRMGTDEMKALEK
ncbi:MAG: N-acetylmuramoyl-L-alanine amidase [Bacteroidetes bacterium]|nr:N-acetylmuramoyl-L-alanine amidase [Bacteroidota bacterium]